MRTVAPPCTSIVARPLQHDEYLILLDVGHGALGDAPDAAHDPSISRLRQHHFRDRRPAGEDLRGIELAWGERHFDGAPHHGAGSFGLRGRVHRAARLAGRGPYEFEPLQHHGVLVADRGAFCLEEPLVGRSPAPERAIPSPSPGELLVDVAEGLGATRVVRMMQSGSPVPSRMTL
jgi:hypothetical protein